MNRHASHPEPGTPTGEAGCRTYRAPRPGTDDFTTLGTRETRQWLEAVRDGHDALVLPEQAAVVTEILEAIYASALKGETIRF